MEDEFPRVLFVSLGLSAPSAREFLATREYGQHIYYDYDRKKVARYVLAEIGTVVGRKEYILDVPPRTEEG